MLKILVVFHSLPNTKAYTTVFFENLLPLLKNKTEVKIFWFVYRPEKQNISFWKESEYSILDIHNYRNAVEVVQQIMPDIIYAHPGTSPIEYSFALVSRDFNIPLIAGEFNNPLYGKSDLSTVLKSYWGQFFQDSVPGDTKEHQKQFMKRGRYFIYKYLFLIKTQKALKMNMKKILGNMFLDIKRQLRWNSYETGPQFSGDVNFAESELVVERLVKAGFKRSSLVTVGNPTYDELFQKLGKLKPSIKKDNKIRVLLVTKNPGDPGGHWSKKLQDSWIRSVVSEVTKYKNEISLVIKIHPSGEVLSQYESVIKSIDPAIQIYQHGNIIKFIEEADVVIGTSASTALVCSLLAGRPIVIWNVYGVKGDAFLEKGLALECKELASLVPLIRQSLTSNHVSTEKKDDFIREFFYKSDGHATERIYNIILDMVKNKNLIQ